VPTPRVTAAFCTFVLAGCAGEPTQPPVATPMHTAAPAPTPTLPPAPAPPLESAAWQPIEGKRAACPDGREECLQIQLPGEGYLSFEGTSPHEWGCANLQGGRIVAALHDREIRLQMDGGMHAVGTGGVCRALATLRGTGMTPLLAPGPWLLVPDGRPMSTRSPTSPLHLRAVRFAPSGRR
jgi:hypothetical protein